MPSDYLYVALQDYRVKPRVVICKRCGRPEYWGEMRWLSGACVCRDCYKDEYVRTYSKPYIWNDLDGKRPSMEEYQIQEMEG